MAIAPGQNILYDQNALLDLRSFKNNFKKTVCLIPFAGDLLGLPIQAKLARLETDSSNYFHKREILRESLYYGCAELFRSYITFFSTPWLLSLAPPSPLIIISLIGFSILLKNILIFGDLERGFGKYSAIAKIALFALNFALFRPQLRMFFLTKNIGYLGGAISVGQLPLLLMKYFLVLVKDSEMDRVQSAIDSYHDERYLQRRLRQLNLNDELARLGLAARESRLQDALSFWSRLLPVEQEPLPSAALLQFDVDTLAPNQRSFQIFLNRLQETADFEQASPDLRQNFALRVASIVHDMAASKEFCDKAITAVENAIIACEDRVAKGFNDLEVLSLQYGRNKPQTAIDTAFLAVRLARLDQVQRKAIELNPGPEGLETQLFLELALKDRLQLPLQTQNMRYSALGAVQSEAVDKTAQEILDATSTDQQLLDILIASSVWTDFLQREHEVFVNDVMGGFQIIAGEGGTDYQKNLADLEQNPNPDWSEFLDQVGPPNISPGDREALQEEVLRTLRAACDSLKGIEYASALSQLIRQIHRKKTSEWLRANGGALRAKLS
jgi:hypothetical protein